MSTNNDQAELKQEISDRLLDSGYSRNYVRRALKVYERNYGHSYNIEVIVEIIRRLQKKDKNKAKKHTHNKSRSETFELSIAHAFPAQNTPKTHTKKTHSKRKKSHMSHKSRSQKQKDYHTQTIDTEHKTDNDYCTGDIVSYKQYKAEIVNISHTSDSQSIQISYPIQPYNRKHKSKCVWVHSSDITPTETETAKDILLDKPSTKNSTDSSQRMPTHIRSSKSVNQSSEMSSSQTQTQTSVSHKSSHHRSRSSYSHRFGNGHVQGQQSYNRGHRQYDYGYNEHSKIVKWINTLKASVSNDRTNNNNPFHNDLLNTFDELKAYVINTPNWEYLVKYNVLNVIAYVISNVLSDKYVNIWHKIIGICLDILIILIDYYIKVNLKQTNKEFEYAIKSIIDIMSYYQAMLDYNVRLSSILISCCSILGKLTFENNENIECVLNFGGIAEILNIVNQCRVEQNEEYNPLIISCLNLLCVLCYNSNYNKQFISNNGGSVAILDLLKHFIAFKYHILSAAENDSHIVMMTSILRTLGNFTFIGKNISDLLDNSLLRILYKLVTEIVVGTDSNMLVLCMQILSDIATYTNTDSAVHNGYSEIESFLISSILKLGRKNKECILLQQCMLNGIAILINLSPEKNGRLLIQQKGELQIFDRIKELNYPSNIAILCLRILKSMSLSHNDISSHLVKQSNVFNFLTHIMKHWRLKEKNKNNLESSLRIECCCKVIRSLTNIHKFSKYANKCHVISGLIKILMINDDEAQENITHGLFSEIVKTFIAVCIDEENCVKLAKHGTKVILLGIHLYDTGNGIGNISENSTISEHGNGNDKNDSFLIDILKIIGMLFVNVSKYKSVCHFLYNFNSVEMAYNILLKYKSNVYICNQFILFLSNMLLAKDEVYHLLETQLQTQSLINKILYLHSSYEPLIKTCHKYHKSIELWLRNNNIKHEKVHQQLRHSNGKAHSRHSHSKGAAQQRSKRFPVFANESIENPYRLGDHIQFKTENGWMHATVVDSENNWIILRLISNGINGFDSVANDKKIHVLKHKTKLRFVNAQSESDDEDDESESNNEISIIQQRQYEMNVFANEISKLNWNLIIANDDDENNETDTTENSRHKWSLFQCFYSEIYGNDNSNNHNYRQIKTEMDEYRMDHNEYFKHLLYNKANKDYISMIALSELYSVRIRVFELDKRNKLTLLYDIGSFNDTLYLPIVTLGYLYKAQYYIIQDMNSFNVHPRPLIKHNHSIPNNIDLRQFRFCKFYERLFNYFDTDCDGQLNGDQIYDFFVSSRLNTDTLRGIWDQSVGDNCPSMSLRQFTVAMNLLLRQQIEERDLRDNDFKHIKHHGSFNMNGKSKKKQKIKVKRDREERDREENGPYGFKRNSANDANSLNEEYNIMNAGIPNLKYPINPFDLNMNKVSANANTQHITVVTQSNNNTSSNIDEYHENMIPNTIPNHSNSVGNVYIQYRNSQRQSNSTNKHTKSAHYSNLPMHKKTDEFNRFYGEISFGDNKRVSEMYYDKIAEFEYNDIEKMMELDYDILIDEFEMSQEHAAIFINKLNKFIKSHKTFKKWLISQLKMRRYFVKFVNEAILTFEIFFHRFQSFHDLIPVIGQKNASDAKVMFRKLPNKYKII